MLVDPLVAFVIGYIVLVIASLRGAKAYISILLMIIVYIILASTPRQTLESIKRLSEWNDVRVFIYIFLSLTIAGIMREKKLLEKMVESTSAIGCRFSLTSVPAIIGLIPMPGGALVSAIALKKKFFEEAKLDGDKATYINYWFRHLWVPSWPLFQSVVITAAVFSLDPLAIVSHTWPATIAAIMGGILVSYPLLRVVTCPSRNTESAARMFLSSVWPLLVLAALFILARTRVSLYIGSIIPPYRVEPMLTSLIIVIMLLLIIYKLSKSEMRSVLRLATKPTIHLVLLESLLFKNLIIETNAAASVSRLASTGIIPIEIIILAIPFILGLAAGGENFFASTAMPLLLPYIASGTGVDWFLLSLAYLGGYLGVMASPVHLCLVLTAEYYNSSVGRALKYVLITVVITIIIGVLLLKILWA